jgi:hypothetical protein
MDALWRLSLIDFKGEWKLAENRGVDQGRAVQMPIWRTLRSWPSTANSEEGGRSRARLTGTVPRQNACRVASNSQETPTLWVRRASPRMIQSDVKPLE